MSLFEEKFPEIDIYLENNASEEPNILKKIRRETFQKTTQPHMISGYIQGRFLSIISKIINPKNILEIGTFTGYSTLSLAEGLVSDGKIYTIDKNEELAYIPRKYFSESIYSHQIEFIVGNALDEIPKINAVLDLVFLDADKENYISYIELIKPKVRKGGIILIDNVLWYGNVVKENPKDKQTKHIKNINKIITEDSDFENVILPLRDGIHLIRKK